MVDLDYDPAIESAVDRILARPQPKRARAAALEEPSDRGVAIPDPLPTDPAAACALGIALAEEASGRCCGCAPGVENPYAMED